MTNKAKRLCEVLTFDGVQVYVSWEDEEGVPRSAYIPTADFLAFVTAWSAAWRERIEAST